MKPAFRCLTILALGALVAACGDQPTSPPGTPARPPALSISDGAHGGGNPGFFFLPPLVRDPSANVEFGDAAPATVSPVVRICRLAGDPNVAPTSCAEEIVSFSGTDIQVADGVYQVNWDTKSTELSTTAFYRMSVFVGTQMLGFADVDPVTSREMKNPRSGEVFTLLDGRTLPIKFVVEEDGLCTGLGECTIATVTNLGGSFTLPSGHGGIFLPEGWLPSGISLITVTLQRVATAGDNDCLEDGFTGPGLVRQYEGCMKITTDPDLTGTAGIQLPAVVGLCLEIPSTHPDYHYLSMIKSDAGRPLEALADADPSVISGFTCAGFAGTAPPPEVIGWLPQPVQQFAATAWRGAVQGLDRIELVKSANAIDLGAGGRMETFSDFSHFGWGMHATMSAASPSAVSIPAGGMTTLSARVLANHVHQGAPSQSPALMNVPVEFRITSGTGGQMAEAGGETYTSGPLTVLTDEAGDARIDFVTGTAPGTYTIVATGDALNAPVTFTVNSGVVTIDFETWPTADGPCSPACALTTQYSPNASFDFVPFGGTSGTPVPAARMEGGPYHAVTNHSATTPVTTAGTLGNLRMTLGGNPTQATFRVRYSPTGEVPGFTVYGFDPIDGVPVAIEGAVTYTVSEFSAPSGAPVREASVTVSVSSGIYRIEMGAGTGADAVYLDDITITGAVFPQID